MGLIAHPGEVASTAVAFDGSTIFTVGGGGRGAGLSVGLNNLKSS